MKKLLLLVLPVLAACTVVEDPYYVYRDDVPRVIVKEHRIHRGPRRVVVKHVRPQPPVVVVKKRRPAVVVTKRQPLPRVRVEEGRIKKKRNKRVVVKKREGRIHGREDQRARVVTQSVRVS